MKALLLENLHPVAERILVEAGFGVITHPGAMDEDELIAALPGVQVLGIRSKTEVTERVLAAAPDLLGVGAYCIGTNQIALQPAASHGVVVFNAPFSNTRSVVELAIAEIIMMARRLTEKDRSLHDGVWDKSATGAHEIRGRSLGIVGYGNIGSQLSVLAESLGMQVYFYDVADKLALGNARRCSSLHELLEVAETVTLHVDGRAGNAGFFGAAEFAAMRPRSLFLNLSRGFVVDYDELREQVLAGHVAGAAVDVFPSEPKKRGDSFDSPLRGLPNVILTPHIGGSTEEAQEDIGRFVSSKLRDFLITGSTTLSVNLPGLAIQALQTNMRIIHVHRNVPGVLATVNQIMAERNVNIEAQNLSTAGEVGYVVSDVHDLDDAALSELQAMPETIRVRVLHRPDAVE